jgi:hypothetical protein
MDGRDIMAIILGRYLSDAGADRNGRPSVIIYRIILSIRRSGSAAPQSS